MTNSQKKWIDEATYEQLLNRWRFAEVGDPIFKDDAGRYYIDKMNERKKELKPGEHAQISKKIGWQ